MHLSLKTIVAAAIAVAGFSSFAAAQNGHGRVQGVVVDESGGVLPGVTVEAAVGGKLLAGSVTNDKGRYSVALPSGAATLTFSLEGFSAASVDVDVPVGADLRLDEFPLAVAPRAETVVVRGDAPVAPMAAPPRAPLPPPPPPPVVMPLPEHDHDAVCGPAKAPATPESLGTITTRIDKTEHANALFARDDQVVIDSGTLNGLAVGQNLVARRNYRPSIHMRAEIGEHTSGVLQIVRTSEKESIAVVVYACDEIRRGDRVAPFTPEPLRAADPFGTPAFDDAAHILFGDSGQTLGAPRQFMVIDRGADQGIHAGQRLTLFRREKDGDRPNIVGDATVVAVRSDSATIRIERVNDAIAFGDGAAPQRSAAPTTRR